VDQKTAYFDFKRSPNIQF
jgi:hypothetical protein